jgi:hypothetical protein
MRINHLYLLGIALAGSPLLAQSSPRRPPSDTARAATAPDSTKLDEDEAPQRLTYGVTGGAMSFPDGRAQQSAGAVFRLHLPYGLAIAATPSTARMQFPTALGGGTSSGLTDLPVDLSIDRGIPRTPLSLGAVLAASVPVGDTATGFGSGKVGYSLSGGVNVAATDRLSFHVGAGRPLSDFSFQSPLGGSSSAWGDLEASYQLSDRVGLSLTGDGDLASQDSVGASRAVGAGLSIALLGRTTLTITASHGVSGAAARWTTAIGVGTDFAWIGSVASASPVQRVVAALGGRSHGHGRGSSSTTTGTPKGKGKG